MKYYKAEDVINAIEDKIAEYIPTLYGRYAEIPLELRMAIEHLPTIEADEDYISRAFALEVIDNYGYNYPTNGDKACAIKNAQRVVPSEDCISRAEVIAEFERRKHKLYEDDYFDELMWIIENIESVVPSRAEGEWIPVSERLPEHDTPKTSQEAHTGIKYLVTLTTGKVVITKWQFYLRGYDESGLLGSWSWGRQYRRMITAWRPLPEAWMEDTNEGTDL